MTQVHMRLKNSSAEEGSYDFEAIGSLRIGNGVWEVTTAEGTFGWNISEIKRYIVREEDQSWQRLDARPEIVEALQSLRNERDMAFKFLSTLRRSAVDVLVNRGDSDDARPEMILAQLAEWTAPGEQPNPEEKTHIADYTPYRHTDGAGNEGFMADCSCGAEFFCPTEKQASDMRRDHIKAARRR